jgi:uncharacterized protein YxeA
VSSLVVFQNVIKIIVGIIGMIISGTLLYYFIKIEGKNQEIQEASENNTVNSGHVNNQVSASSAGNNGENQVYDTMDLTGGDSEYTVLLDEEEHGDETSLL